MLLSHLYNADTFFSLHVMTAWTTPVVAVRGFGLWVGLRYFTCVTEAFATMHAVCQCEAIVLFMPWNSRTL